MHISSSLDFREDQCRIKRTVSKTATARYGWQCRTLARPSYNATGVVRHRHNMIMLDFWALTLFVDIHNTEVIIALVAIPGSPRD